VNRGEGPAKSLDHLLSRRRVRLIVRGGEKIWQKKEPVMLSLTREGPFRERRGRVTKTQLGGTVANGQGKEGKGKGEGSCFSVNRSTKCRHPDRDAQAIKTHPPAQWVPNLFHTGRQEGDGAKGLKTEEYTSGGRHFQEKGRFAWDHRERMVSRGSRRQYKERKEEASRTGIGGHQRTKSAHLIIFMDA